MIPTCDRKRLVEQVLLASDRHQLDQILGGARVDLAAAEPRIDESAKADASQMARAVRGDIAEQMRDDALRQVVGLNLVGDGQAAAAWARGPSGRRSTRLSRPSWPR